MLNRFIVAAVVVGLVAACAKTPEITSVTSDGLTMVSNRWTDDGTKTAAARGACAIYGKRPIHISGFTPAVGGVGDTYACITAERAQDVGAE